MANDLKKIMHIEDDTVIRMMTAQMLESGGYDVVSFENAQSACENYPVTEPDLVLMDFFLPDMDGPDLIDFLRALDPREPLPVIITSGSKEDEIKADLEHYNVLGYIKKPYKPDEILAVVKDLWAVYKDANA